MALVFPIYPLASGKQGNCNQDQYHSLRLRALSREGHSYEQTTATILSNQGVNAWVLQSNSGQNITITTNCVSSFRFQLNHHFLWEVS